MKFTASIAIAFLSSVSVFAATPSAVYSNATSCFLPSQGPLEGAYLSPKPHQKINVNDEFKIIFCSGRYFKEHTDFMNYVITSNDTDAYYVTPQTTNTTITVSLPYFGNDANRGYVVGKKYFLNILETHNNYYGSESITHTKIPITITF